jgi:hypothetical protein
MQIQDERPRVTGKMLVKTISPVARLRAGHDFCNLPPA